MLLVTIAETVTTATVSIEEEIEWLQDFEALCLKHMDNVNLSIKTVAEDLAMSYSTLWRELKRTIGMTPNQYLQEIRFREARKYLEERRYSSIKRVAYAVGFKDVRNFSRNFKKRFGKYPSEFLE